MLSFSISYWDLMKFHYFADTTERGDRGWKRGWLLPWRPCHEVDTGPWRYPNLGPLGHKLVTHITDLGCFLTSRNDSLLPRERVFCHEGHASIQVLSKWMLYMVSMALRVSKFGLWSNRFSAGGRNTPISSHKIPYIPPTLKE
jgi:hypothetical protein